MTIQDIKNKYGIISLEMERCLNEDNTKTEWLRHWDNDTRISVVMHEEVKDGIKADKSRNDLVIKSKQVASKATGELYTNVIVSIVTKKHLEEIF